MSSAEPAVYRLCVEGRLDPSWSDRLAGMAIEPGARGPRVVTTLHGELADQAALHGVLNALMELHLPILSTERVPGPERPATRSKTLEA